VIQGLVNLAMMLWYLKTRFDGFWRAFEWTMLREQLAYALPFGVAGMMFSVQMDLHSYFVANRFSAEMYALYAVGCFQLPLVGLLNDSVASVAIPQVSDLQRRGRYREILLLMTRVIRKLAAVTLPLYAFLVVVAPDFITFLFTERYRASWPIFAINLTMLPLTSVMVDPVFRAFAGSRFYLVKLRVGLILAMAVMLWFATKSAMGLVGIIAIVVAINATGRLMAIVVAGRLLGVTRRDLWLLRDVGKLAMAAATAAVATAAVRMSMPATRPVLVLLVSGLMFASVYLITTIGLRIVTSDEREIIRAHMTQMLRWTRTYGQ
jgi:O-antigen/teichoic acid export membrane protein